MNMALPALRVTGAPSWIPPSKNATVPVGVPEPVAGAIVAVKVTDCPSNDGLAEEITMEFVGTPIDGVASPPSGMANGLPDVPIVTNTFPPVGKYGAEVEVYVSVVGAKETWMVQLKPAPRLDGQLFVCEKFSVVRMPVIVNAVSPALVKITLWDGLVLSTGCVPKLRDAGLATGTGPVTPAPFNPMASNPPAAFVLIVRFPLEGPATVGENLKL